MNQRSKIVRLTKLAGKDDSHISPGYWVEGIKSRELEVGHHIHLCPFNRDSLNNRWDWFTTTKVTEINNGVVSTLNSKWKYEEITYPQSKQETRSANRRVHEEEEGLS